MLFGAIYPAIFRELTMAR